MDSGRDTGRRIVFSFIIRYRRACRRRLYAAKAYQRGVGRGAGVGRGLGVGEHLPVHGVGVGVGVGVDAPAGQYLPPVPKLVVPSNPPHTIISLPVQTAV